jgi:hypothetical protein
LGFFFNEEKDGQVVRTKQAKKLSSRGSLMAIFPKEPMESPQLPF